MSATIGLFLAAFLLAGLRGGALADVEGAGIGAGERSSDAHLMALAAAFNLAGGLALGKLAGVMRSLEKLKLSHGALKKQADGLQVRKTIPGSLPRNCLVNLNTQCLNGEDAPHIVELIEH